MMKDSNSCIEWCLLFIVRTNYPKGLKKIFGEGFAIYSLCESDTMFFAAPLFVSIKQT